MCNSLQHLHNGCGFHGRMRECFRRIERGSTCQIQCVHTAGFDQCCLYAHFGYLSIGSIRPVHYLDIGPFGLRVAVSTVNPKPE